MSETLAMSLLTLEWILKFCCLFWILVPAEMPPEESNPNESLVLSVLMNFNADAKITFL